MEVDTDASTTVIRERYWRQIPRLLKLVKTAIMLVIHTGEELLVCGTSQVQYGEQLTTLSLTTTRTFINGTRLPAANEASIPLSHLTWGNGAKAFVYNGPLEGFMPEATL